MVDTPDNSSSRHNVEPDPAPSSIPSVTPDNSSSNRDVEPDPAAPPIAAVTPNNASSNRDIEPDPAPSSTNSRIQAVCTVLADAQADIDMKEGKSTTMSNEMRQKRKAALDKWIESNTDPRTKKGRFVFRRGCAKQCLTQILGGSGPHPHPVVTKPPDIKGESNPFIKPNEFYVAGAESFNPFGPRFPGDVGLVDQSVFGRVPGFDQKEFHFFVQCSTHPHKRHWHGKDAIGGRMYVGVYRRVVDKDDEDDLVTMVHFASNDLDASNKMQIADYYAKRNDKELGTNWRNTSPEYKLFVSIAKEEIGDEEWENLSSKQKDVQAVYYELLTTNYTMEIVPVTFVRYDENLYQALVDSGAAISRKGQSGRVAVTPGALHQYF